MKTRKSIAYAYATSPRAIELGFENTGCYYIEYITTNEDSVNISADKQVGGFETREPDLLASFNEADGEPCEMSAKYHPEYYSETV